MCNWCPCQSWTGRRSGWTSASQSAPTPPHPAATWADPRGAPATGATGATGAAAGDTEAAGAGTDTGAGEEEVLQGSNVLAGFQEVAESVLQAEVALAAASLQIQDPVSELLAT